MAPTLLVVFHELDAVGTANKWRCTELALPRWRISLGLLSSRPIRVWQVSEFPSILRLDNTPLNGGPRFVDPQTLGRVSDAVTWGSVSLETLLPPCFDVPGSGDALNPGRCGWQSDGGTRPTSCTLRFHVLQ